MCLSSHRSARRAGLGVSTAAWFATSEALPAFADVELSTPSENQVPACRPGHERIPLVGLDRPALHRFRTVTGRVGTTPAASWSIPRRTHARFRGTRTRRVDQLPDAPPSVVEVVCAGLVTMGWVSGWALVAGSTLVAASFRSRSACRHSAQTGEKTAQTIEMVMP
jgi:hypothetical protein